MQYKASADTLSRLLTVFVASIFLGTVIHNILQQRNMPGDQDLLPVLVPGIAMMLIFCLAYLYSPLSYKIADTRIIVKRPVKDLVIEIGDIGEVLAATKEDMKGSMRTFANGGLFGYYGRYYNHAYGKMKWYATRRDQYVVLKMKDGRTIVLTPDDMGMAEEIRRLMLKS